MTDIVIRSSVIELGLFGDDYDAFVAALRVEGLDAHIADVPEYRSVDKDAVEFGIWIAEHVLEIAAGVSALEAIGRAANKTISKRKRARKSQRLRRLPIYGSGGRIHGYIELPADDDEPKDRREAGGS